MVTAAKTSAGPFRVRNLPTDDRLSEVQAFFVEHISDGAPMPVFDVDAQRQLSRRVGVDIDMNVGGVLVSGSVVAAVHWAVDFEDVHIFSEKDESLGRAHAEQVRILQNVAVAPEYRGMGLGRQLVEYVEIRSAAVGASYVIGIASGPEVYAFYERLGYTVLKKGQSLILDVGGRRLAHPVNGAMPLRWFVKALE